MYAFSLIYHLKHSYQPKKPFKFLVTAKCHTIFLDAFLDFGMLRINANTMCRHLVIFGAYIGCLCINRDWYLGVASGFFVDFS